MLLLECLKLNYVNLFHHCAHCLDSRKVMQKCPFGVICKAFFFKEEQHPLNQVLTRLNSVSESNLLKGNRGIFKSDPCIPNLNVRELNTWPKFRQSVSKGRNSNES